VSHNDDAGHSPSGDDPIAILSRFFAQSIPTGPKKMGG